MRILVASDLHFEKQFDGGERLCGILGESEPDLLVCAGDLCDFDTMGRSLELISSTFKETVYVLGNHECYGSSSIGEAQLVAGGHCARLGNVRLLESSSVEVGGLRFLGCTLWFPYPPAAGRESEWAMNDFECIGEFRRDVGDLNRRSVRFLEDNVRAGDFVVTHHLPSWACVHPLWAASPLNPFFVCDVERVIRRQRPAFWAHGHTHESVDKEIHGTRVVCNPFGYLMTMRGPEVNPRFEPAKLIEIPA